MIIVGLDPGQEGGMAMFYDGSVECFSFKGKDEYEIGHQFDLLSCSGAKVFLEKVHSAPGQGVASMFTFGKNFGFLRGLLVANKIPFEEIPPQEWQKALRIPPRGKKTKKEHKLLLQQRAKQLYPNVKGIDLTTSDAVLIGAYGMAINKNRLKIEISEMDI